ncbi:hypothetical protein FRB95_009711 [Tulasnella sp. JGI-2019a]|nr:hypothetical protein FRB95_009711 [Tulasnella sp. JGI-2019a]
MESGYESNDSSYQVARILQRSPSASQSSSPPRTSGHCPLGEASTSSPTLLLSELAPHELRTMLNWTVRPIEPKGFPGNKCKWPGCRSTTWTMGEPNRGYAFLSCWELMRRHLERHVHDNAEMKCQWPECRNPWARNGKAPKTHMALHIKRRGCMVRDCKLRIASSQIEDGSLLLAHVYDQHPNATRADCWPLAISLPTLGLSAHSNYPRYFPQSTVPVMQVVAPIVHPAPRHEESSHSPQSQCHKTLLQYDWLDSTLTLMIPVKARQAAKAASGTELAPVSLEPNYRASRRQPYKETEPQLRRVTTIGWEVWSKSQVNLLERMDIDG